MYHIGIIAIQGHCSTVALFKGSVLLNAISEERFTRVKEDSTFPYLGIESLLQSNSITMKDVKHISFAWRPLKGIGAHIKNALFYPAYAFQRRDNGGMSRFTKFFLMVNLKNAIQERFGYAPKITYYDHHLCHSLSAIYHNKTTKCLSLVIDGASESATLSVYSFNDGKHELLAEANQPHSLGYFYSAITQFLGFRPDFDEYKVMGLASYGDPIYLDRMNKVISYDKHQFFKADLSMLNIHKSGNDFYSLKFCELFPEYDRSNFKVRADIAKSAQVHLENIVCQIVEDIKNDYGESCDHLVCSGGVFQNCVMNQKIREDKKFKNFFFSPLSSDLGTAVGAGQAYMLSQNINPTLIETMYLGPIYTDNQITSALNKNGIKYRKLESVKELAELLSQGKIIGYYEEGGSELGPRALGKRSILADPRHKEMQSVLNKKIKQRESFRPFAPVVLESDAKEIFEIDNPKAFAYMIETVKVRDRYAPQLEAVTHIDQTARIQTVSSLHSSRLCRIIEEFKSKTGLGVLLNTSFNSQDEPIVNTPEDAIKCFYFTNLDYLVIGDYIVKNDKILSEH